MISSAYPSLRFSVGLAGRAIATSLLTLFSAVSPAVVVHADQAISSGFEDNPKAVLDEAWQIVHREYVDDTFNQTDWLEVRERLLGQDYSSREAAYSALREELRALQDPYTRFLNPQEYSDLTDQTAGEISGVGLQT